MKQLTGLLFLFMLLFSCSEQSNPVTLSKELQADSQNLDNYFSALTNLKKFNGVVLAYKNDTLLLEKAYTFYQSPDSSSYITTNYQFDIHSVSKLMTHYLIVKLQEDGVISENQTLETFYPDFPNAKEITIEMLLNHSSGLPRELQNFTQKEFNLTSDEIVDLAKKEKLLFEPGTDIQYSNVGYELLYNVISKIYKKSFAQCLVDEIFNPLAMNHSGAHFFSNEDRVENLAKNHVLKDSTLFQVPNILEDEFKTARIYSTLSDLNKFLVELEKEPFRSEISNKKGIIAKDGGSKGIRAQVYADVENQFRFVLLANFDGMPFFQTIEDVAKILKREPFELPKEINRQPIVLENEVLERYVGAYSFADFDGLVLSIQIEGKTLVVFQNEEKIATLKPESETVFFENPKAAESFEFVKNESGTYNALMGWKGISVEGKRVENK